MGPSRTFAVGQYVELYLTIPSSFGGSIEAGTRGIVRETRNDPDGAVGYLVAFLSSERGTGAEAWLMAEDLFPA
ncbi:MAG: hypothetical protein QOF73_5546 [Thermomicrobiales bacterium]|nr:hypothetical protein [Thermomicrobiales bacterium]